MTADRPKPQRILAWHFLAGPMPGVLRDGRPAPADGEILRHDGPLVLYKSGLHASVHAIDALYYASSNIVCRVECGGTIECGNDKLVCTERRILWRADAEATLRAFARWCALSVIHLRDPAWAAAWAARASTWASASMTAAWIVAREASMAAAGAAAWVVARAAARASAWAVQNVRLEAMLLALAPAGGAQ